LNSICKRIAFAILAVTGLLVLGAATASASNSYTVERTIHLPALAVTNLCNQGAMKDQVDLQGDEHIRVTTTTRSDGTMIVNSNFNAPNLTGERYFPTPPIAYKGADGHQNFAYYPPPPYPYTLQVVHWTKLVPQYAAPTMWLVTVLRETVAPDAPAIVTVDRAYLTCSEPCDQSS